MSTNQKSKPSDLALKKVAQEKLRKYRRDLLIKRLTILASSSAVVVIFTIIFAMVLGGKFTGLLNFFGLEPIQNELSGIYTDCSNIKNRDNRYCRKQFTRAADVEWKNLNLNSKDGSKFRLSSPIE